MGKQYICSDCNKHLSCYHSLWRHKKTCKAKHVDSNNAYSGINETYNCPMLEDAGKSTIAWRNHNPTPKRLNHDEESDEEMFEPLPKGDIAKYAWCDK